jgi:hypothetical protein
MVAKDHRIITHNLKGYNFLRKWAASKPLKGFSYTSNIDGHWLACGFPGTKE